MASYRLFVNQDDKGIWYGETHQDVLQSYEYDTNSDITGNIISIISNPEGTIAAYRSNNNDVYLIVEEDEKIFLDIIYTVLAWLMLVSGASISIYIIITIIWRLLS